MLEAVGGMLSPAIGIAISPVPIMAIILMMLSERARTVGLAFVLGWLTAVTVVVVVFWQVAGLLPGLGEGPGTITGVIQLVLGAALLALAVKRWRHLPAPGEPHPLPPWLAALDSLTPARAFGIAALLGGVNPKNLVLAISAGASLSNAAPGAGAALAALAVYVVIASLTVAGPPLLRVLAPRTAEAFLTRVREWLGSSSAIVMAVLLTVLSVVLLSKGLTALSG
ncbi:GAP family protein [Pseudactinotalea sp.]|uniref:GAP family protein n=1 Tax=Pseudactinotalea sp. TaxID=1926260 RepID=UPI003B3ABB0C